MPYGVEPVVGGQLIGWTMIINAASAPTVISAGLTRWASVDGTGLLRRRGRPGSDTGRGSGRA